ncbi:MAG: hypothetical protein AABZ47_03270 [Planctomycetota bacterium]
MNEVLSGLQVMAKKQRSLLLDDRLSQLIDAMQLGSGATFTRIVSAALLQFIFDDSPGSDARWIRFAVQLERGDITITDIPVLLSAERVHYNEDTWGRLGGAEQPIIDGYYKFQKKHFELVKTAWEQILLPKGKKSFENLINKIKSCPFRSKSKEDKEELESATTDIE